MLQDKEATGQELVQQTLNGLRMQISCLRISLEKEREKCKSLEKQITHFQKGKIVDSAEISSDDIATCTRVLNHLKANKMETYDSRFTEVGELAKQVYTFAILQNYLRRKKSDEISIKSAPAHVRKSVNKQIMGSTKIRLKEHLKPNLQIIEEVQQIIQDGIPEEESFITTGEKIIDQEASKSGTTTLLTPTDCYICKKKFKVLHFFYDRLCVACAEKCYEKRMQTANLEGKVAIITGGRIKVGYETALKLLRSGATVLVTTRFPRHACLCYSHEPDFEKWADRLKIYGPLDFCNSKSIENFVEYVKTTYPEVHILVNNATQTITRPPEYYQSLVRFESAPLSPSAVRCCVYNDAKYEGENRELIATVEDDSPYWEGEIFDTRAKHSWTSTIAEVPTQEVEEVQKVNVVAPFILCGQLKKHMSESSGLKFIINVSAMQGKFYRAWKTFNHPHTNMSKAALNMMTRTCHYEFANKNIFMNSVDPGWIANDNPFPKAVKMNQTVQFSPPLDAIESAARVCDPIFSAMKGEPPCHGLFLKDYEKSLW